MCNLLQITDVNIGFAARRSLNESKASDTQSQIFHKECLPLLQKITSKFIHINSIKF